MITFEFILDPNEEPQPTDYFSLGDMVVTGPQATVSSAGRTPNQAMMIFLSIVDLLDSIRNLLLDTGRSHYDFIGADSSFRISFTKTAENKVSVVAYGVNVGETNHADLVQSLWQATKTFLASYGKYAENHPDLVSAVEDFKAAFHVS